MSCKYLPKRSEVVCACMLISGGLWVLEYNSLVRLEVVG